MKNFVFEMQSTRSSNSPDSGKILVESTYCISNDDRYLKKNKKLVILKPSKVISLVLYPEPQALSPSYEFLLTYDSTLLPITVDIYSLSFLLFFVLTLNS